jgi:MFS family permease
MEYISVLKVLYFMSFGSMGVLFPIIPIFYEGLGFSKTNIGILTAIPPVTTFLFGPLWSVLFDAKKWHGIGTQLTQLTSAAATTAGVLVTSFPTMVCVVTASSVLRAPVSAQVDAHTIGLLRGKYGDVRLYGAIGYGLLSFAGGTMTGGNASDFNAVFFLYALFSIFTGYILLVTRLGEGGEHCSSGGAKGRTSNSTSSRDLRGGGMAGAPPMSLMDVLMTCFSQAPVATFMLVMVIAGTAFGIVESFLFIRLKELGASGLLLGTARLIMCGSEVPMFKLAPRIHRRIGTWQLLLFTQIIFILRNLYYAVLSDPLWVLPCEVLHGITFATMWSTSTAYAHAVAPPGLASTFQAILTAVHFGVGCAVGGVVGGVAFDHFGGVTVFWLNACLCVASSIITLFAIFGDFDDAVLAHGTLEEEGPAGRGGVGATGGGGGGSGDDDGGGGGGGGIEGLARGGTGPGKRQAGKSYLPAALREEEEEEDDEEEEEDDDEDGEQDEGLRSGSSCGRGGGDSSMHAFSVAGLESL